MSDYLPFTVPFWKKVGLSFARAAISSALVLLPPALISIVQDGPSVANISALVGVIIVPSLTAGFRAVQALTTNLESPKA